MTTAATRITVRRVPTSTSLAQRGKRAESALPGTELRVGTPGRRDKGSAEDSSPGGANESIDSLQHGAWPYHGVSARIVSAGRRRTLTADSPQTERRGADGGQGGPRAHDDDADGYYYDVEVPAAR